MYEKVKNLEPKMFRMNNKTIIDDYRLYPIQ